MPSPDHPMFITNLYDWLSALKDTIIPRTKYFNVEEFVRVYMRIGRYVVDGAVIQCVTIATVDCDRPGEGYFKRFMTNIEEFCRANLPEHTIVVENVVNPDLLQQLQKHGYKTYDEHRDSTGNTTVAHTYKKP